MIQISQGDAPSLYATGQQYYNRAESAWSESGLLTHLNTAQTASHGLLGHTYKQTTQNAVKLDAMQQQLTALTQQVGQMLNRVL